jgi:sirohydrochlorin ferrochelatase
MVRVISALKVMHLVKTGILIIGRDSRADGSVRSATALRDYLETKGRKNIRVAYHSGSPRPMDVMREMHRDGIDTFCILPQTVFEGRLTVWLMPADAGLPDNCGSWTMIDGKDVATRFATAPGEDDAMVEGVADRMGAPDGRTGILLVSYGSRLSMAAKAMRKYQEALRERGWPASFGFLSSDPSVAEGARELLDTGISRIRVVPLMISTEGKGFAEAFSALERSAAIEMDVEDPISGSDLYMEAMDRRVPPGW